ncbi:transcriptional repressor LexA [Corynebacterium mendelii]|uniref:LexA repressor n=1 Tax=Corynebacterium mendelii TaxID=2765362 RepID=A0A939IWE4_9CORY|nr:transcriptional repressor LexA [Corynebacterium mendelii]MBN9643325.1 transcriptional repressor LexA [Corynebacterium mendelii]
MGRPKKKVTDALTDRQKRILEVIHDAIKLRGYPPSIREIGDTTGLQSTSSVAYQLKELEKKGFLRRDPNKPRAVHVRKLPDGRDPAPAPVDYPADGPEHTRPAIVPLVGQIAAGIPITAEQNIDEYFPLPTELVGDGDLFMLQVVGESMKDRGILDGDFVVIRAQKTCENGEIVAAMFDGEATVKRFHKDADGKAWLVPANDSFDARRAEDAEIIGVVVSSFRKY